MNPVLLLCAADLVAITALTFGLYFPRHHRRDLVVAFLGVNVGVLAVSVVLGSTAVGAGLGLGLFGVLSIIRLRSDEIAQHEVAYYFASLALGLISGLGGAPTATTLGLMLLVVGVLYLGDHPRLFRRVRQQTMNLDAAFLDEADLREQLAMRLSGRILHVVVRHVDLVNDTTMVEVRYVAERAAVREPSPVVERSRVVA